MSKTRTISADELSAAITAELNNYAKESIEELKKGIEDVSKECRNEIVEKSPVKSGRYKKGWRVTKVLDTPYNVVYQIHNKTNYQLVHLLEYGHDKWLYGIKIDGERVNPVPHVRPAEQNAIDRLDRKIKEIF